MLGFHALADANDQLTPDPAEIVDARWFTRTEVRAAATPWKGIAFRERDADPETGLNLLPVLDPPRRNDT